MGISIFSLASYLFLLGGWFVGLLCVSPVASLVILLIGLLGGGSTCDLNSLSGGLTAVGLTTVGVWAVGFGFVDVSGFGIGGFAAKDLRTWAANSARVAGMGRVPFGSGSGSEGSCEVSWMARCGTIFSERIGF
jgi:hypothetical protein